MSGTLGEKVFFGGSGSSPVLYDRDGIPTQVAEDTVDPTNNRGFPSLSMFYQDGVLLPISEDTTTPANTVALPVKDYELNSIISALIGQLARAASLGVTLSTEDVALLDQIVANTADHNTIIAVYHNAATTPITTAGVVVGVLPADGRSITVQNNADAVNVFVDSNLVGVSLPGQPLILDTIVTAGDITLQSNTGASITGGDFAITIKG